ncbi:predicted protein [Nematostella vectensis]|uniref:Uncharacterized protein n=1 Tax=Nematostella vectensis TaxID=45351 RepID=A7S5T3_NEMVE|nr:predicted protein [Nematostella vectensis]|eukprot:XP_001633022.1 predicted protein [Nematostella vectensis]
MAKALLLLLVVYSALLNSCQAWVDVKDRIKGRVIHLETLLKRGRWLRQIDNKDSDGSRYLFIDPLAERDTYYEPRVQFVTACDNYLCLEALSLRDYFLAAGYPPDHDKHTVKLQYSTYPAGDLIGNYAKEFEVGEDKYTIEEIPLDSGATRKRKMPSPPGQPLEEKSEL